MQDTIYCFGEILWDIFSQKKLPGGAPMNVAIGLNNLGSPANVISRVGNDQLGKELIAFLKTKNCSTEYIQIDNTHPTGVVQVNADALGNNSYTIIQPAAWDFIENNKTIQNNIANAKAIIFGSLAMRNSHSQQSLKNILNTNVQKIFDVNLRAPFYNQSLIDEFLTYADIVKMNDEELAIIAQWHQLNHFDETIIIKEIAEKFNLQMLIITKGDKGACVFYQNTLYTHSGFKVIIKDTVGSGDAFLAGFLHQYYQHQNISKAVEYACALGALVATHQGANPLITPNQIQQFITTCKP